MTSTKQRRSRCLPRIRLGAMVAIVALGVLLIPTLTAAQPGQAPQTGPTFRVLYTFTGGADGGWPYAALIFDPTRNLLVGTAYTGTYAGVVFGVNPTTGQETVLYAFTEYWADGGDPERGVIVDSAGNLYGTTPDGGSYEHGVVFKLDPAGQETVLYTFTGGADGSLPEASLVRDSSGNLYGTTDQGGAYGMGTVFELSPTGQETVLHSFTGGVDGSEPWAGLIQDVKGNLYGTTVLGGRYGDGVVFKLSPTGQETVLHNFNGGEGGGEPVCLIRDSSGNFYGTTDAGGDLNGCGGNGCGVVFKLSPTGQETVLYSFTGGTDGDNSSSSGVVLDPSGNLYGTTEAGGAYGDGVVFEVSPTGQETVLHSFSGLDGSNPYGGVIRDKAGNLYGTTGFGGHQKGCYGYGCGVVFKITP